MPKKSTKKTVRTGVVAEPVTADTQTDEIETSEEVLPERPDTSAEKESDIAQVLGSLVNEIKSIKNELDDIKSGGVNQFKREARPEDIEAAREHRKGIDPKISQIVDSMLGEDFGAEVKPLGDRPGFRFSLIVPPRLSDNVRDRRPVIDPETGKYKKDAAGNTVFEDYIPEDRRSRIIASSDSYDNITQHCERVRAYIVSYFQKVNKPLPEFKVK